MQITGVDFKKYPTIAALRTTPARALALDSTAAVLCDILVWQGLSATVDGAPISRWASKQSVIRKRRAPAESTITTITTAACLTYPSPLDHPTISRSLGAWCGVLGGLASRPPIKCAQLLGPLHAGTPSLTTLLDYARAANGQSDPTLNQNRFVVQALETASMESAAFDETVHWSFTNVVNR